MDDAAIRQLDGPGLDAAAYMLGLAPADVRPHDGQECLCMRHAEDTQFVDDDGQAWTPHTTVAAADAVFRELRVKGWATDISGTYDRGGCAATKRPGKPIVCWWGVNYADTEPLALLRCACLAIASTQETHA